MRLAWSLFSSLSGTPDRTVTLSERSVQLFLTALSAVHEQIELTESELDELRTAVSEAEYEIDPT